MDYANGKIYVLRNYNNDYFYIGSSCMPLAKRLYKHKQDLKRNISITYKKMQDIGITPEVLYIELIELCPCDNVYQLRKKEGKTISEMLNSEYSEFCLNRRISGRSDKQYYKDNLKKFKDYIKQYHIDNREAIRERKKDYYKANSDIILQKVGCIACKCMISKISFKEHCLTKKHQKNLELTKLNN